MTIFKGDGMPQIGTSGRSYLLIRDPLAGRLTGHAATSYRPLMGGRIAGEALAEVRAWATRRTSGAGG
jgi:hypothetical protein